jgi:hypothetical protein
MCRERPEDLGGVADYRVDFDLHFLAQLGYRAPQLLLSLQPVLALHVLAVLSGLPGDVGLDLGVQAGETLATVTARSFALVRRASACALRSASRPSSLSMKATPIVFTRPLRVQSSGTTATGHGAPWSSRSAVEPASTRPAVDRREEPTPSSPASSCSAAS